jgi:hypothetical protein
VCDVLNNEIKRCHEMGIQVIYQLAMVTWRRHFLDKTWTMEEITGDPLDNRVTDPGAPLDRGKKITINGGT